MWLVIGFIKRQCEIRLLTRIWNRFQSAYCIICCDKQELSRLSTLDRGFFKGLNSLSCANIKALHRFIISLNCLTSDSTPMAHLRSLMCLWSVCYSSVSTLFSTSSPFPYLYYYLRSFRTYYNGCIWPPSIVLVSMASICFLT